MTRDDTLSPVHGLLKNTSMVDFPGRLAVVLFLPGCNFNCGYCHNGELRRADLPRLTWRQLETSLRTHRGNWADGTVITGGEPTLSPQLPELIDRLRTLGLAIKLDSNGSRPEVLESLLPRIDYLAMDVKCAPATYPALTGWRDTEALSRSFELLKARRCPGELRTTVLTSLHTDEEMAAIAQWITGTPAWYLQAFVPRDQLPDPKLCQLPRTPTDRLHQIVARLNTPNLPIFVR